MIGRLAALAVVAVLAGCGDEARSADEPVPTESASLPVGTLPPEVADLFRRFDAIVEKPGFDHEQATLAKLPQGDKALYVLWAIDGEINNGGFSQYLFNPTAELHDEAVRSANLVGATRTAALLERLPAALGVERISDSRAERQRLLDRLTDEQESALNGLDDEWYDGISAEIEASLIAFVRTHPQAFSLP